MTEKPRSALLLDSPSLIFRAYYALPATITDKSGQAVNAVRGYLDMVAHLIRTESPSRVVHCLDQNWRPQFRVDAFPAYKAQRLAEDGTNQTEPDDLVPQFGIIKEIIGATGMDWAVADDFEADDVIGTLADQATSEAPVTIVSGDRDLFQLVRDGAVIQLFPIKGVKEVRRVDEADVMERYGVPAARYADFAILRGDPSDGLPGLAGVGPKRAAELINKYPSIDALIRDGANQQSRLQGAIAGAVDYLNAMKLVVPVRLDVDIDLQKGSLDRLKLEQLGAQYNAESPIARLLEALDGTNAVSA